MSISTNSINYGDDFSSAENGEVNGDAISLDNDEQFNRNSELITDQQQFKEFREKFSRMEMELKMAKLELENKEQKLKLQEMMVEQKALKEKMAKIEQEKEKNVIFPNLSTSEEMSVLIARIAELNRANTAEPSVASSADLFGQNGNDISGQLSKILEKISELEKQQKQQQNENTSKANSDQISKMQNDQNILLEKISELEKEKLRKALLNFQQNYWDANDCDERLEIIGEKNLTVRYKGNDCVWRCAFAKHSILLNKNSSDIFYYEISVKNMKSFLIFGFSAKQKSNFEWIFQNGTYGYDNFGDIWINGERKGRIAKYSYGVGDTVGIAVNLTTRQIIFTKNGLCLGFSDFYVAPSLADDSFHPFVTLFHYGDKIDANFGPNFKFDLTTL
ncbi:hypothetical protein niasHS_005026 [Heterodera schachtii]|uniref:B30.2/SPRY domain-containing protein n=1 Tax=Heterodera schachtii TaxID=97005 RepID=A0ABD2JKE9_HETSC